MKISVVSLQQHPTMSPNQIRTRRRWLAFGLWVSLWCVAAVHAQDDSLGLTIEPDHMGIGAVAQPGCWTPLLLTLENKLAQPRKVRCQWVYHDSDGDQVLAGRSVTLSPQRTQRVWLYGVPPVNTTANDKWQIQVFDDESKRPLASIETSPPSLLAPRINVVAVTGSLMLGLEPYTSLVTQHESCHVVRDVDPALLPDRWYGLSIIQTLVWTPSGKDPSDAAISPDSLQALRQWIVRGGHLIVVLPLAGDTWFEGPLANLLPAVRVQRTGDTQAPTWLGQPHTQTPVMIDMKVLQPAGDEVAVRLRDSAGRPLAVSRRYGFGAVTVIGVDLSDARLARAGLPHGSGLWRPLLGWQSPAFSKEQVELMLKGQQIVRPELRRYAQVDHFLAKKIAMYGTATPALLTAVILFTLYWAVAGPIGFTVLKRRGLVQHSWLVFLSVVGLFSALSWGTAVVLRPTKTAAEHFTVLDVDVRSGLARTQTWLSLFVPRRGKLDVVVGPPDTGKGQHTLSSPGFDPSGDSGFIDQQQYSIEALSPDQALLPIRATSKQLHVDFLARPNRDAQTLEPAWLGPQGKLTIQDNRLTGTLTHSLHGDLKNLLVVYCPGNGQVPLIRRYSAPWSANQTLDMESLNLLRTGQPMVLPFRYDAKGDRLWQHEGYLGKVLAYKAGASTHAADPALATVADDQVVQSVEILSFYSMLPPPDYRNLNMISGPESWGYRRQQGRPLDLTSILSTRCVILIGYLEQGSMPVPLTIDGQPFDSNGWTVVRWICPVQAGAVSPVAK